MNNCGLSFGAPSVRWIPRISVYPSSDSETAKKTYALQIRYGELYCAYCGRKIIKIQDIEPGRENLPAHRWCARAFGYLTASEFSRKLRVCGSVRKLEKSLKKEQAAKSARKSARECKAWLAECMHKNSVEL